MSDTRLAEFVESMPSTRLGWLTDVEQAPLSIRHDARLDHAIDLFQRHAHMRFIAVVDDHDQPVGALLERDIRGLLLNPYGHALLRNPAYGASLDRHVKAMPVADASAPVPELIAAYRQADGTEGMILTRGGRLFATLSNRRLVHLAARYELERASEQVARAARIEEASIGFEHEVGYMARELATLAATLHEHARTTHAHAAETGDRAAEAIVAAARGAEHLAGIEVEGQSLLAALTQVADDTRAAKSAAEDGVARVGEGIERTEALDRSANSIGSIAQLIRRISAQVNMLALNATIEAARAGDAGRGFSVVAMSIKQLSDETARAAETVADHVADVQGAVEGVADTHRRIDGAVRSIADRSARIMDAAEAQRQAMHLITAHVGEAADGAAATRLEAEGINAGAALALDSAGGMGTLADRLTSQARALADQARDFLAELREDPALPATR